MRVQSKISSAAVLVGLVLWGAPAPAGAGPLSESSRPSRAATKGPAGKGANQGDFPDAGPAASESSSPPKPSPTLFERMRVYGQKIPREVEQRARDLPEALRNFPSQAGRLPGRLGQGMGEFIHEVPFPGAPPVKERPKGWARQFFLELPKKEMAEAEGFGLVPELGFAQETQFLYGLAFAIGSFATPHDNIQAGLDSTTRNQQSVEIRYIARSFYTDYLRLEFFARARRWLTAYYGEGNESLEQDEDFFDFNSYRVRLGTWLNLPGHLRIGFLFGSEQWSIKQATFRPGGPFFVPAPPNGIGGGREIFIGGGIALDTRDNEFFPNKGLLLEFRARRTDQALGAEFDFMRITADARAFWTPWKVGNIIALRGYLDSTFSGAAPFFLEPQLGGDTINRGYFRGRFRDHNALVASLEYRFPIYGRINAALFAELGQVARELNDFEIDGFKPTGGAAVGYLIPPGKVLLVRLEVAASEDGVTFFLRFGNPF